MKLGELIDFLEQCPPDSEVKFVGAVEGTPGFFCSHRGDYSKLALDPTGTAPLYVKNLLQDAIAADGSNFEGWKGGDYHMDRSTPVWADPWGSCPHNAITGVSTDTGTVSLITTNVDEYIW